MTQSLTTLADNLILRKAITDRLAMIDCEISTAERAGNETFITRIEREERETLIDNLRIVQDEIEREKAEASTDNLAR